MARARARADPSTSTAPFAFRPRPRQLDVTYDDLEDLLRESVPRLAAFGPDVILAVGGGGFVPARLLRTHLRVPILAVSLRLYDDGSTVPREAGPEVGQWFDESYGFGALVRGGRVLVVDDCDDTRTTLAAVLEELRGRNAPAAIAALVLHNKRKPKRAALPEGVGYFACAEVDDAWIRYPWDYPRRRAPARWAAPYYAAALALALALLAARARATPG